MTTRASTFSAAYWLSLPSLLLNIRPPYEPETFPIAVKAAIVARWREKSWPAVHFFPEAVSARPEADRDWRDLLQPGACCIGSSLLSPWSSERFRNLHHDIGAPPLIIVGGELDRSVLATAVGAAERNVPVTVITASAVCGGFHGNSAAASREGIKSILRGFALEASAAEILAATVATR